MEARHEDDVEDDGSRDESDQRDDDDSLDYYHDTLPSSRGDEVPSQPNPQHENGNTQDEIYYDVGYYSSGGEDDYQHNYGTNSSQNEYHDYHGSQEYYDHDDYVNGYSDDNVDVYDCHYGDDASYDAYNSDDDYGW